LRSNKVVTPGSYKHDIRFTSIMVLKLKLRPPLRSSRSEYFFQHLIASPAPAARPPRGSHASVFQTTMSTRSFAIPIAKEEPSTCGYCSPPGQRSEDAKNYKVAGLLAMHLSCEVGTGIGHQRATCTKGYHDVLSPHRWTRQL
jgi:hypothetical protein